MIAIAPSQRFIIQPGSGHSYYEAPAIEPTTRGTRNGRWVLQEYRNGAWQNNTLPVSLTHAEAKYCAHAKESPQARLRLQAVE